MGYVRLIAGQWGGRRLPVLDSPGLRPTGDRMRETLFNWLQSHIAGANCLDLFAGTGALGLEALSRYARSSVFVEPGHEVRECLMDSARLLGLEPVLIGDSDADTCGVNQAIKATVFAGTAAQFLARNTARYELVFIDPPFDMAIQGETLDKLIPVSVVNNGLIYVESPAAQPLQGLPDGCCIHKEKRFADVRAYLLRYAGS